MASGITAALQLANKKGFIEEGKHWLCVEHVYSKQTHLLYVYTSPYYSLYMFSVWSMCTVNKHLLYVYASPYYSLYMFSVWSTCTVNKHLLYVYTGPYYSLYMFSVWSMCTVNLLYMVIQFEIRHSGTEVFRLVEVMCRVGISFMRA